MPRPLRICLPDIIFHVLNRGNNRQAVFQRESDYQHYLEIFRRYKEEFQFKLFAYCLMTNHIHLIIKTSPSGTISQIMKAITIAHTRHYHKVYQASGYIWQGRFKSPTVSDDEYLLTLMRYIEQNPVRAGMVEYPEQYPFSSYHENTGTGKVSLIDKEKNPVHLSLGNTIQERAKRYKEFATALLDEDKLKPIRKTLNGQSHFASEQFLMQLKERLSKE